MVYAYGTSVNYRESFGMFACNGILFNHESPLRGESFVARKITRALTRISPGMQECLFPGNMDSLRDCEHACDCVRAQRIMFQQDRAEDFVIATGRQYSVRAFVEQTGKLLSMDIAWRRNGVAEEGVDRNSGRTVVRVDPRSFRPSEVEPLLGDPTKAREQLVQEMVAHDLEIAKRDALMAQQGLKTYQHHE
jgi:GDPmannose 4,6-dehydratase